MDRKTRDVISSIFFLAVAMVVFIGVAKLPIGTLDSPRIGLWPLIQAVLLTLLSLILLGQAVKRKDQEKTPFLAGPGSWQRIGVTLGALVGVGLLYETLGFLISVFLLIVLLGRLIGSMKWWMALMVAVASSLCSYGLFGLLLDTPLPAGILGLF
jgi:hypothetical protein